MKTSEDRPIRGHVRLAGHRRVSHGLFLEIREHLSQFDEFVRDLRALLLVLPAGAVFTHVTAARLLGWQLPALPEPVPFFAAVRCDQRPRRPGLICSRLTLESTPGSAHGLPVDAAEEILLRCARDLSVLDLVILIDSALRLGHLDPARMRALLATSRPGVVRLRKAWALADAKAESAGETVLRIFHIAMDVAVESQFEVYDERGNFLGRADLIIKGTHQLREYDGAGHREGKQHTKDLRRGRGLVGTPFERSGFTLDDLLNHPAVLMHELDRLLDRPHKLARLARWREILDESLYSETGRQRIMNRWRRSMQVAEWPSTA